MITNKLTGKSYIGASNNIERRWEQHKTYGELLIGKQIKKYGPENFTLKILAEYPEEIIYDIEPEYIAAYNTLDDGYNLTKGGEHNQNTTGYYRVSKTKSKYYSIGYYYDYTIRKNGEEISLTNKSIEELERKVKNKGFEWKILNKEKAKKTLQENQEDLKNKQYYAHNPTGFYRVHKRSTWKYTYRFWKNDKHHAMSDYSIDGLQKKVINKGWPWKVIDNELAELTILECFENSKLPWNSTGFFRVHKHRDENCTQGFFYVYQYTENGSTIQLTATDLNKLKEKVKSKGLEWKVIMESQAKETMRVNDENMLKISYDNDSTGFYRVSKTNSKIWGHYYKYYYKDNGKPSALQSINIRVLKKNVEEKGLPWKIIDEEKAKQTLKESDDNNQNYGANSTGYYRVGTMVEPRVNQGFVYRYHYYDEQGKPKSLTSVSLKTLEKKVKAKGLPWRIVNEALAEKTRNSKKQIKSQKSLDNFY